MSLSSYATLGRSGLRISPFTLGTMTFGEDHGWGSSPEDSKSILAAYLDQGGNSIDTANIYTNGHAEAIVGEYFYGKSALRDRVVIGTKFFANLYENDPNGVDPAVRRSCNSCKTRCAVCAPTTSTSIGCTISIRPRQWRRPCERWTIWSATARSAMSVSPTSPRGRRRRRPLLRAPGLGSRHRTAARVQPSRTDLGRRVDTHGPGDGYG